jgi:hypothetical protein
MQINKLQIKGVAIKSLHEFVEMQYPDVYTDWLKKLDPDVRDLFLKGVLASRWYDADKFLRQPAILAAKMLFMSIEEFGWESGVYSSHMALNGIYRFFLRFGGPAALIKRVPLFVQTYYRPADVKVLFVDEKQRFAKLEFVNFVSKDDIIVHRIRGWGYNTLLEAGAQNAELNISDVLDDRNFMLSIKWV